MPTFCPQAVHRHPTRTCCCWVAGYGCAAVPIGHAGGTSALCTCSNNRHNLNGEAQGTKTSTSPRKEDLSVQHVVQLNKAGAKLACCVTERACKTQAPHSNPLKHIPRYYNTYLNCPAGVKRLMQLISEHTHPSMSMHPLPLLTHTPGRQHIQAAECCAGGHQCCRGQPGQGVAEQPCFKAHI